MSYSKRAIRASLFAFVSALFVAVIGYLIRIILARNLSVEDYGLYFAVFAFVSFVLFFRDFGLGSALIKYIAEYRVKSQHPEIKTSIYSVFYSLLAFSLIYGLLLFFGAPYISTYYFKDERALLLLYFFIAYILFSALTIFLKSIFQGFQKIKTFSMVEVVRMIFVLILILIFLKLDYNIYSPIFAQVISWILVFLMFLPFFFKTFPYFKYRTKNLLSITKNLYSFGFAVTFTQIGSKIISRADTLMLTYFTSLTDVGIYNVVLPSALLFLFFGTSISTILYPMVSELWAKKDKKRLSEGIQLVYKYTFIIAIPLFLAFFAFSQVFIRLMFGEGYIGGVLTFQILLLGILFYLVAGINNNILAGIGKPKIVTKIILLTAGINIILNLIMIPLFGISGAGIATSFSYVLVMVMSTRSVSSYVQLSIPWKEWIKTFLIGGIFLVVIYSIKEFLNINIWLKVIISISIASAIYLLSLYVLKIIDVQEIKKYIRKVLH